MLRYIAEETVLPPDTRLVFHYLIRLREEALFFDHFTKIKERFGHLLDLHIWITRQEPAAQSLVFPTGINVHAQVASSSQQIGQPWDWWDTFTNCAFEHFNHNHNDNDKSSLVYICGPQALTDRLVDLYHAKGLTIEDGHIQIEKWW